VLITTVKGFTVFALANTDRRNSLCAFEIMVRVARFGIK